MNQVFSHPGQPQMQAEVILASKTTTSANPIYTIRLRYPRIIHGEIMTHRVFSRNARSSRAVPVKTMLNEVENTPFIPWHWGKNQKGMQAAEECNEPVTIFPQLYLEDVSREEAWVWASRNAIDVAREFMEAGYHKQLPNRLLEPFSWIDTLITSTEWDNFLWLREHGAAEPHLQDLAKLAHHALGTSDFQVLKPGEWHLPYITNADRAVSKGWEMPDDWLCKISAARCARISYKPFDGDASYEREIERYNHLVTDERVHASPLEHQATPDEMLTASIDLFEDDNASLSPDETLDAQRVFKHKQLHGNLNGWIQYRKTVPNEAKMEGVL